MARHRRRSVKGKKVVYVTPYRNLAVEVMEMYAKKGESAQIESEKDVDGRVMFVVYLMS